MRYTPRAISVAAAFLALLLVLVALTGFPSSAHSVTGRDAAVILLATLTLLLLAIVLARLQNFKGSQPLGDIRAQSLFRVVSRRLAPPAVAAAITAEHTARPGDALAVFGAMLLASLAFGGTRYPLHLSGVARFIFDLLMPVIGISVALLVAAMWGVSLQPAAVVVPLLGAWFVTFAGGWLEEAFNATRPVRLAVIGQPGLAGAFAVEMKNAKVRDHRVVGWISDRPQSTVTPSGGPSPGSLDLEWLGSVDDIRSAVVQHRIDLLVMTPRRGAPDLFMQTVESCVDLPVRLVQAAHLYEEMHGRVPVAAINSAWFAYIMHPNFSSRATWSKRAMDLSVSSLLAVALAPLFAAVALTVKAGDRGPVFFRQRRVGAHGREFDVLKFRTMKVGAERPGEARWSSADDDRVTRVGRFLRRSHLDEMPQLINVLVGSMSLVGPRPERPEFVAGLEKKIPYYSRRVLVKPGITGWAQVRSGYAGSDVGTAFKLSHDLYYIKHRSLVFDLLTLVETIRTLGADLQFRQQTVSETFIVGGAEVAEEAAPVGRPAGLGSTVAVRA